MIKYICPKCHKEFKTKIQVKENVYIVYSNERYDDSENVKYTNSVWPFHLECIEQFKKENEYQIPDHEIFSYKLVVV